MPERPGLIGEAHGGTLFLDEIGDLPADLQVHLLRVLDRDGEYQRLGEASSRRADVRVVAATNRDLAALRDDLLARYKLRIALPNLDARREDIPLLVRHLVAVAAAESPELVARFLDDTGEPRVDPALLDHLLRRSYTANVRELDAVVWMAIANSTDRLELSDEVLAPWSAIQPATAEQQTREVELTADVVRASVEQHHGNLSRAAQTLGLPSRYALYRLLKKHRIDLQSLRK
jgi:DNA-binding NtrC family response regulator